jgi:hypothetical protein
MQPNILTISGAKYQVFSDENNVNLPAGSVDVFALRRVFSLAINSPKIVNFADLQGFWAINSCYISSPQDSEIKVEIVDSNGVTFFTELLLRNQTPKAFPTVIVNNTVSLKLTAARSAINLVLIYLKPVHLAYSKDF